MLGHVRAVGYHTHNRSSGCNPHVQIRSYSLFVAHVAAQPRPKVGLPPGTQLLEGNGKKRELTQAEKQQKKETLQRWIDQQHAKHSETIITKYALKDENKATHILPFKKRLAIRRRFFDKSGTIAAPNPLSVKLDLVDLHKQAIALADKKEAEWLEEWKKKKAQQAQQQIPQGQDQKPQQQQKQQQQQQKQQQKPQQKPEQKK